MKLQRRQAQVSDLNEVQALLAKLEAVFQLPARLRVAIDAKAYASAVDSYIGARPVLKRAGYKVGLLMLPQAHLKRGAERIVAPDNAWQCGHGEIAMPIPARSDGPSEAARQR